MTRFMSIPVLFSVIWFLLPVQSAGIIFTEITMQAGITHQHVPSILESGSPIQRQHNMMTGGAAAEDFDGDGWLDLFVLGGHQSPPYLYMNNRNGTFSNEAASRGIQLLMITPAGAAAADFDNDGDIDICATEQFAPHYLLMNDGTGQFTVDQVQLLWPPEMGASPSWGDVDNDGLLELAISAWSPPGLENAENLILYRNVGNGELIPYPFRTQPFYEVYSFTPRFADLNNNRFQDLPVTNDFLRSQIYINQGDSLFERGHPSNGTGTDENGMGSAIGDYDNDGDLDWFVSSIFDGDPNPEFNWGITGNRLYRNQGDGTFEDVTGTAGVRDGNWGWGSSFGDLDNDGDLDLYHVNGWSEDIHGDDVLIKWDNQPAVLFENMGNGTFTETAMTSGVDNSGQGRGVILFDLDNNGKLDIFLTNNQDLVHNGQTWERLPAHPVLYHNDTDNGNHWLKVSLDGAPPFHSHGVGSRVYIRTSSGSQMRELHASSGYMAQEAGRIAHFGLGEAMVVDEVRAEWINGDATLFENIQSDQSIVLPSPMANISSRQVDIGSQVTASAAGGFPKTGILKWIIEGTEHEDPVTYTFNVPGERELRLNRLDQDGETLLFSEIYRIQVVAPDNGVQGSLWLSLD
jgi:hypothetical protein